MRQARNRITRDDGQLAAPDEYIDEAVVGDAHVEMMNDRAAFMSLGHAAGDECFWIFVKKGKLRIRYSEHRPPRPPRCERAERGCALVAGHDGLCIEPFCIEPPAHPGAA